VAASGFLGVNLFFVCLSAILLLPWFTYRYLEFSHVKSFSDVLLRPSGQVDRLAVAT
jgi:hypothetical protein